MEYKYKKYDVWEVKKNGHLHGRVLILESTNNSSVKCEIIFYKLSHLIGSTKKYVLKGNWKKCKYTESPLYKALEQMSKSGEK